MPAGTPQPIVDKLNAEITRIITSPEIKDRLISQMGATVVPMLPDDFARFVKDELAKWEKVVTEGKLKID